MEPTEDNGLIAASATTQLLVLQLDQQFTASLYCPVRLDDVTEFNSKSGGAITVEILSFRRHRQVFPSSAPSFPPPLQSVSHTGHHMQ